MVPVSNLIPFAIDKMAVALRCLDHGMNPTVFPLVLITLTLTGCHELLPLLVDARPDRHASQQLYEAQLFFELGLGQQSAEPGVVLHVEGRIPRDLVDTVGDLLLDVSITEDPESPVPNHEAA